MQLALKVGGQVIEISEKRGICMCRGISQLVRERVRVREKAQIDKPVALHIIIAKGRNEDIPNNYINFVFALSVACRAKQNKMLPMGNL